LRQRALAVCGGGELDAHCVARCGVVGSDRYPDVEMIDSWKTLLRTALLMSCTSRSEVACLVDLCRLALAVRGGEGEPAFSIVHLGHV
jgi:hypothetical protein